MTADPNCPTSLAGDCVLLMNPDVGQKTKFRAHSPIPSARNFRRRKLSLRFLLKLIVSSLTTCLELETELRS